MSISQHNRRLWQIEARAVATGVVGGFLAGLAMGIVLHLGTGLLAVLGSFLGETSVLRGWLVHLVIAMAFGGLFAFVVAYPGVRTYMRSFSVSEFVLVGLAYGTMVGFVSVAILPFVFQLPWVTAAAQPPYPGIPGPTVAGLVPAGVFAIAHMIYGAILGGVYASLGEDLQDAGELESTPRPR